MHNVSARERGELNVLDIVGFANRNIIYRQLRLSLDRVSINRKLTFLLKFDSMILCEFSFWSNLCHTFMLVDLFADNVEVLLIHECLTQLKLLHCPTWTLHQQANMNNFSNCANILRNMSNFDHRANVPYSLNLVIFSWKYLFTKVYLIWKLWYIWFFVWMLISLLFIIQMLTSFYFLIGFSFRFSNSPTDDIRQALILFPNFI